VPAQLSCRLTPYSQLREKIAAGKVSEKREGRREDGRDERKRRDGMKTTR